MILRPLLRGPRTGPACGTLAALHWIHIVSITAVVCLVPPLLASVPAAVVFHVFCGPAAHLAGWFLGAPVIAHEGWNGMVWVLPHPVLDLHVGRQCSGLTFYGMACLLVAWWWVRKPGGWVWAWTALGIAYPLVIAANAARLVAVFHGRLFVEDFLPPAYFSMVHFATGALVFLCFLIGLHVLLNGSFLNRNPQDEPSV